MLGGRILCALALLGAAPAPVAEEAAIRAHVAWLASDELRGREAGTANYDKAAAYVAARFADAGLRGGGDAGGYLQAVPLVRYRALSGGMVRVGAKALRPGTHFRIAANPAAVATRVAARVVFVGQGVSAPTLGHDDYAGIDAAGAIVAWVAGAPADLPSEERAYFATEAAKLRFAAQHGAVGAVLLTADRARGGAAPEGVTWANPDGSGHVAVPGVPFLATFTDAGTRALFRGAARSWDETRAAPDGVQRFPAQPLAVTLDVGSGTSFAPLASSNVVGVIPGSDARLRSEVVVLSAHLDHIGVLDRPDAAGDRIANGALDDALGVASLIAAARRLRDGAPPKSTIAFVAFTAEEKGLVGSSWFVRHRPAGLADIVADVNLDMPVLLYRFTDLVAFGGDRSTLGAVIARAAAAAGVGVSPDPIANLAIFVRSDHFRFVEQGVPAVFLWPGIAAEGARAAFEDFMATRYHRAGDDLAQGIMWDQAVRFVDINVRIAREIADAPVRPAWKRGDWFGDAFGGAR